MVAHINNASIWEVQQENYQYKASLKYVVKLKLPNKHWTSKHSKNSLRDGELQ